jgi:hypothetical protein
MRKEREGQKIRHHKALGSASLSCPQSWRASARRARPQATYSRKQESRPHLGRCALPQTKPFAAAARAGEGRRGAFYPLQEHSLI